MQVLQDLSKDLREPARGAKVFKDEAVFSCHSQDGEEGIYVCLRTFWGFSLRDARKHAERTGNRLFLRLKQTKKRFRTEAPQAGQEGGEAAGAAVGAPVTRMAIGVEGGFQLDYRYEVETDSRVVLLPEGTEYALDAPDLPEKLRLVCRAVQEADAAQKAAECDALNSVWEGEQRRPSRFSDTLEQLTNGKRVAPSGWRCEAPGCGLSDNLWLNLSDGSILCGRSNFDGSGGRNHAVEHYEATGRRYPLVVKLGTIQPSGAADVFSYAEDDMMIDTNLGQHLAHFGIALLDCAKTEKTVAELEIELNQRVEEWTRIQETGSRLQAVAGPGLTGLRNLGNSCYLNATVQLLSHIPTWLSTYSAHADRIYDRVWRSVSSSRPVDPSTDFNVQMAKLVCGLNSGEFSKVPQDDAETDDKQQGVVVRDNGIAPSMFRTLIGVGHAEFSTRRQQDAHEFLLHLLNQVERNARVDGLPSDALDVLRFEVEERLQLPNKPCYKVERRPDFVLALPIPLERAVNRADVLAFEEKRAKFTDTSSHATSSATEKVIPRIDFASCVEAFLEHDVRSGVQLFGAQTDLLGTVRLTSFPDYLVIQLKRFTVEEGWVPKKLEVEVTVPDEIDLEILRAKPLPSDARDISEADVARDARAGASTSAAAPPSVQPNAEYVALLCSMGVEQAQAELALSATRNAGVDEALNWIFENPNARSLPPPPAPNNSPSKTAAAREPPADAIAALTCMGFTDDHAKLALEHTDNDPQRAVDWLFSHTDELDTLLAQKRSVSTPGASATTSAPARTLQPAHNYRNGTARYRLVGFVSHMGTSCVTGHYVAHLLKQPGWCIFNDDKVALSEKPPREFGYLYLFKRADVPQ